MEIIKILENKYDIFGEIKKMLRKYKFYYKFSIFKTIV